MISNEVPPKNIAKLVPTPNNTTKAGRMEIKPKNTEPGKVIRVTTESMNSAVFSPGDVTEGIRLAEPAYRITVRLSSQSVEAYGQRFSLQAGMTLGADIVLERRSLIRWLFDPLYSLRGRA